ncbi:hypothetical protein V5O48_012224 [Marasmius crinis-equi]|uniref:Uncharacterized protein n=1 Tax=Marasmius crinis-equi TaxID=585013 RepID=A0ABR3F3E2_9AGAR
MVGLNSVTIRADGDFLVSLALTTGPGSKRDAAKITREVVLDCSTFPADGTLNIRLTNLREYPQSNCDFATDSDTQSSYDSATSETESEQISGSSTVKIEEIPRVVDFSLEGSGDARDKEKLREGRVEDTEIVPDSEEER